MTTLEEIRSSPAGRSLALARGVVQTLRAEGWTVREAAAHAAGIADAVAMRIWRRAGLTADVRLIVRCHSDGERVLFSAADAVAEPLRSFCFAETRTGDETPTAGARVTPPPTRVRAATFRADDASFGTAVDQAFASVSALICDLHDHELEVYHTDADTYAEAGIAYERDVPHVTFVHPIVVTNAALWTLSDPDRLTPRPSLRLHRTRAASGERSWIDIVQADAFTTFAQNTTRHYGNALKKRRFTAG